MIVADSLTKAYQDGERSVLALDDCSFRIEQGEQVALLGRSGSGKTTLVNLLAGLDQPTTGSLEVAGTNLQGLSSKQISKYRREKIGIVFQSFELIPHRTALQNVELPLVLAESSRRERKNRVVELLEKVGLGHRLDHYPYQLSGGEKQRVAVARAMVNNPPVLFADEPTGNLDAESTELVMDLLSELANKQNTTLLLVTHDLELADNCASRTLELVAGRLTGTDDGASQ